MQILPINSINSLNPLVQAPAILPAAAVGTRNQTSAPHTGAGQTGTGQPGGGDAPAVIGINQNQGEIRLSFQPGQGEAAEAAARALTEMAQKAQIELQFSRDDETKTIVIKLIDRQSGETVRQIPTEALLHLSAALGRSQGQLFDQTV